MADVRYIFGNALTGEVIDEIAMQGVSLSDSVQGGEFQGSFGLNQTGRQNDDLAGATLPGRSYLVVERDELPIWGGLVWSRTYQSQAESVQLFAKTFDMYPSKRFISFDQEWLDVDPRNVFLALYRKMQLDPRNIDVNVPADFTDGLHPIDFEVVGSELRPFRSEMDALAQSEFPFEWRVAVTRDAGAYVRTLLVGSPTLGLPSGDTNPVFEYPGNILNFWRNDTIANAGTNIFGVGAGEGDSMPSIEIFFPDLESAGWPRWDALIARKEIEDPTLLEHVTRAQAKVLKAPSGIYTVQLKADRDPKFGDWSVGDYCTLALKSGIAPFGISQEARILQYDYTPPSSEAVEEVKLTFEGDDLA